MPYFQYQQRDRAGKLFRGQLEAASAREAATKLRGDGMFLISLKPAVEVTSVTRSSGFTFRRVKLRDLLVFTKQFAVLIRAGVNLNNCLNLLAQQIENPYFAEIILQIRGNVESGESLHGSLKKFPKVFPSLYIHMIEAGEASGQLDTILDRLAEHLEREFEIRKKVVGALTYPMAILMTAVIAVFVLMVFVVPQFISMFAGFNIELPFITKFLIAASGFCSTYWWAILIFLAFLGWGFLQYRSSQQGRKKIDSFLYRLRVVGPVIQKLGAARFARTLGTLLNSGVSIITSLEIVERAAGNTVISEAVGEAKVNIIRGSVISVPLAQTKVFPPLVTQLIAVGEETGEMSALLNQIADFYEKEAAYAIDGLTKLLEPAIIIFVGGIIAVIVAAIYLPIFNMTQIAK